MEEGGRGVGGAAARNGDASDLARGNFQTSYLRWIGANNDPDVFDLVFSSKRIPPNGANRGHYRNAKVDALTGSARR
jgi:peptide/nickel transport system substrate-binding protein